MVSLPAIGKPDGTDGKPGAAVRITLRFLQFVLAVTVAGMYGVDLHHATQAHAYLDGKWLYAEIVAGLSAITCIIYALLHRVHSHNMFSWDWVVFILWTALFGLFGKIYIPANPTPEQTGQIRMQHAVWVDLACMILWFLSAIYTTINFWRRRRGAAPPAFEGSKV